MAKKGRTYKHPSNGNCKDTKDFRRPGKKGPSKDKNYEEDNYKTMDNDLSWYSKNSQLLFDSANINYPYPVGSKMSLSYKSAAEDSTLEYYLPGIYQIGWRPSVGVSKDEASAVNIAARNVYSYIRQANSGAKNYDSNDLMIYLLAMDSCYAFHAFLIRLYGVIRNTAVTVRYMPEALTKVCGGDYTDLTAHLADLRYYINFYGARLSAMAVPNNMYYFTRHRWMSANVYADEPSSKPQLYVFVPEGFYKFGYDADKAGKLIYTPLGAVPSGVTSEVANIKGLTFEQLRTYGEALLAPIIGDEDFNIMSGDILKAYSSNIVMVPTITEDYTTGFAYSPEVLEQIHNLQCFETDWDANTWDIVQSADKSYLEFKPTCSPIVVMPEVFIDSKLDVPSAGDSMILSRLITMIELDPEDPDTTAYLSTSGSEVVTSCHEYQYVTTTDAIGFPGTLVGRNMPTLNYLLPSVNASTGSVVNDSLTWNKIVNSLGVGSADRAPLRTWLIGSAKMTTTTSGKTYSASMVIRVTGQKNNLSKLGRDSLDRMHQTALLSLFNSSCRFPL
uniref:Capsid n=1 Tax=Macaque picobirnavirus 8 TaxID=2078824 RepID=A0A2L1FE69_9VIRU|nr:capsid [Macaque picobirnavirus 8]